MSPVGVDLAGRRVGDGAPCYVIAEVGSNHNGDLKMARELIDVAAEARVDAVKFQTYTGTDLYSSRTPSFDYLGSDVRPHELLDSIALPRDWQAELADHCAGRGVAFMSSPFDRAAVDQLDALDVPAFKIASFEIVDLGFIEYVAERGRPVIISTGMATLAEIDEAVTTCRSVGNEQIILLQCASLYPAPAETMNLSAIPALEAAFGLPVGLSDHTPGTHLAAASVALGARMVEKHFTLDRSLPGPDHPFAIEPEELRDLVHHVRDVELALGDGRKTGPSSAEAEEMFTKARRSIIAAAPIPAGTEITSEMLTVKRPGFGIKPRLIDAVVGRRARVDIEFDDVITWEMV